MLYSRRHLDMSDYFQSRSKWENIGSHSQGSPPQNPLLVFCDLILKYEKYKSDNVELDDASFSSSGSDRTNDSFSSENENIDEKYLNEEGKTDSDQEAWNLITCFCMKPFRGRPMIECTNCGTWIHMSCAKIRPNNVPEIYVCNFCHEPKDNKRRSERIRSDDRRFS